MKAIFTYDYGAGLMDQIANLGYEVSLVHESEIANTDLVNDAEILVCYNPFQRLDIRQMKKLKWIQLSSIGFDQLPLEAVLDQGIMVTNNQGGYSKPMGEWIVMNILEILKKRKVMYKNQQGSHWAMDSSIMELVNKRVGFLGTGTIAREAAQRLQGFEATVIGFNTSGHDTTFFDSCYAIDQLMDHLPHLDVVVITLPHTDKTHHFFKASHMAAMKDQSILINVSRGANLVEADLIDYLERDKFLGVALDVFEQEPLPKDHPFWTHEALYLSAHNSWVSEMKNLRRFDMIKDNMTRYKHGESLRNIVNLKRGY